MKKIWILNHYASKMIEDTGGRHYWIAKNLISNGYAPTIFCASTIHNSSRNISTEGKNHIIKKSSDIPFVIIKTPNYLGNGIKRIINMITFYKRLFTISKKIAKEEGKPDLILASSVHPLTLVAGIKIAKKFKISCICEIRDLWPESLIAYGSLRRNSILTKILFIGEKWIYKNANKIIFTMEGGKDYIIEKKWDSNNGGPINIKNVYYINNGVDLDAFNYNKKFFHINDEDLENKKLFKVVYTGSIRKVNDINYLTEIARELKYLLQKDIKLLIYGDGDEKEYLIQKCKAEGIDNIVFKGAVPKQVIPFILNQSDLNILHFQQNHIKKYGASLNKLFEYFAATKPIISDCKFGYDLIERYKCGIVIDNGKPKDIAKEIINIKNLPINDYETMCNNSLIALEKYNFKYLTKKLIELL